MEVQSFYQTDIVFYFFAIGQIVFGLLAGIFAALSFAYATKDHLGKKVLHPKWRKAAWICLFIMILIMLFRPGGLFIKS